MTSETRTIRRLGGGGVEPEKEARTGYTSDYLGRMEEITYEDGETVRYGYNYGGQIRTVTGTRRGEVFEYVKDIHYDEYDQRVSITYGNGVNTRYEYDRDRRWLKHITTRYKWSGGEETYQDTGYTFDRAGNVTGYVNRTGYYETEQGYAYDGLYQLVKARGESVTREAGMTVYRTAYEQRYAFDDIGNMVRKESESRASTGNRVGTDLNYRFDYEYYERSNDNINRNWVAGGATTVTMPKVTKVTNVTFGLTEELTMKTERQIVNEIAKDVTLSAVNDLLTSN